MTRVPIAAAVVAAAAALAAGSAGAAVIDVGMPASVYVAAGGSDTGECATAASACASITYALTQVATGGTVYVSGTLDVNGTTADGDASGGGIEIYRDVTIAAAPGSSSATIDGDGTNWLFYVNNGAYVTFSGLTLENGYSTARAVGGAITNGGVGTIEIDNSTLSGNVTTGSDAGGAVNNSASGTIAVTGSTFDANDASDHGGAINNADNETGTLDVTDSTFTDNGDATGGNANGGAIDNGSDGGSGTLVVSGSTFSGNDGWDGGAIDSADSNSGHDSVTVTDSTFTGNTTPHNGTNGGAIDSGNAGGSTLDIAGSSFTDNVSHGYGAAIADDADTTIADSTFTGNNGNVDNGGTSVIGGAIESSGSMAITGTTFDGNGAVGTGDLDGGAIENEGAMTVADSTFEDNQSYQFGGAVNNTGTLSISDSSFDGNQSNEDGGAIVNASGGSGGTLEVTGSTFEDNSAQLSNGGAIDNADLLGSGTAIVSDSTFAGNSAGDVGGAIDNGDDGWDGDEGLSSDGTLSVLASTFAGNTAAVGDTIDNGDNTGIGVVYAAADLFDGGCGNDTVDHTGSLQGLDSTGGTWNDEGYNAATDGTCLSGGSGDVDDSSVGADLGSLTSNGGLTDTIMPAAGDLAIGLIPSGTTVSFDVGSGGPSASFSCPATSDQRGALEPPADGTACDAGAVQTWGVLVGSGSSVVRDDAASPQTTPGVSGSQGGTADRSAALSIPANVRRAVARAKRQARHAKHRARHTHHRARHARRRVRHTNHRTKHI